VHAVFERLDFSRSGPEEARGLIDEALKQYGLDGAAPGGGTWHPVVYQMVSDVLNSPLLPHDPGFRLASLSPDRKITEMEFYYPVRRLSPARLRAALRRATGGDGSGTDFSVSSERLEFRPFHGYMRGFVDLVFEHGGKYYLLDWKTNRLGYDRRDYDHDGLRRCVAEESYYLQYYIYTVALHRYLAGRLADYDYDAHFGGVVYLFIRGVHPEAPGSGVYFDRPGRALTEEFDEAMR
jgi:exodeoxyribonuclease V beta subunit